MIRRLQPGIYENLLTASLEAEIAGRERENWKIHTGSMDSDMRPELLARHAYSLIRRALETVQGTEEQQIAQQVELVNRLVELLYGYGVTVDEQVSNTALVLLEAAKHPHRDGGLPRPTLSLRQTGLLVNGRRDVQIAREIIQEIPSADRIDLLCAFVRFSGLRLFQAELAARIRQGASVRVIASVYTGTTERRALDLLVQIGARVKISYDVTRTRLHAKAWLFHRESGLHTAYIGSSNLTHTAQVEGLEWNVRISSAENPRVIERFEAVFEQYWQEPEFEDYNPSQDAVRLDSALSRPSHGSIVGDYHEPILLFDVSPKPHQSVALEALESERNRDHHRNLIVAATGTGKTWIAAFDFKRLRQQHPGHTLLFVAHREEILQQSQKVFQLVLREPDFGEVLAGGKRPHEGRYVFASIQSLINRIDRIPPNDFTVVIVDEFHHAAAASYDRLLTYLQPRILLGLTATPERADGKSVLTWFDGRIAYESRLWDALDQGLLCPFHYFGVTDQTDLTSIQFERGRYLSGELNNVYTGDHYRVKRICQAVVDYVTDPNQMRALGFCAGVNHARFMAIEFSRYGYPAIALDASTPTEERRSALGQLRRGELRVIFAVDLFNEGVDIPEVDTLLLLRPTESATVFMQQLGRGLRWAERKHVLTVLDFVGQVRKEYRYDIRYRALLGGTRHQVKKAIEFDFPLLPPGCVIKLDRQAKDIVLKNLQQAVRNARQWMVSDLQELGFGTRLGHFMREANQDLEDIYARPQSGHCFTQLRQQAFDPETCLTHSSDPLFRSAGRLLHVDDPERLHLWRSILANDHPNPISRLWGREREYRLGLMLFSILGGRGKPITEADQLVHRVHENPELCQEYCDLLDILSDRVRTVAEPLHPENVMPLASHATYTLGEIMAAYKRLDQHHAINLPQTGVLWDESSQTDLLFITLEKSERDFSPTTRYADYPLSPDLFHWESQNKTTPNSRDGRRYISQPTQQTKVILFVRERKKDRRGETNPYLCLGRAHYQRHESERPMKIWWKLERPMPGWLYQAGKVASG